jgi:hypothetical protein
MQPVAPKVNCARCKEALSSAQTDTERDCLSIQASRKGSCAAAFAPEEPLWAFKRAAGSPEEVTSESQLRRQFSSGELDASALVRSASQDNYAKADACPEFRDAAKPPHPPEPADPLWEFKADSRARTQTVRQSELMQRFLTGSLDADTLVRKKRPGSFVRARECSLFASIARPRAAPSRTPGPLPHPDSTPTRRPLLASSPIAPPHALPRTTETGIAIEVPRRDFLKRIMKAVGIVIAGSYGISRLVKPSKTALQSQAPKPTSVWGSNEEIQLLGKYKREGSYHTLELYSGGEYRIEAFDYNNVTGKTVFLDEYTGKWFVKDGNLIISYFGGIEYRYYKIRSDGSLKCFRSKWTDGGEDENYDDGETWIKAPL